MLHGLHGFCARWSIALVAVLADVFAGRDAAGQGGGGMGGGGFGFGQAVGGIAIDADGIINTIDPAALQELAVARRAALAKGDAADAGAVRRVSLKGLEAVLAAVARGLNDPDGAARSAAARAYWAALDAGHDMKVLDAWLSSLAAKEQKLIQRSRVTKR